MDVVVAELGEVVATRSGDKGGMADIGVWVERPEQFEWLVEFLTIERIKALIPELAGLPIERHVLPNLLGMNILAHNYLKFGVASCTRLDAQAKGVGEHLASRRVEVPRKLLRQNEK